MARITLRNVSKRFRADSDYLSRRFGSGVRARGEDDETMTDQIMALDDLTLVIEDGETVAIVGPSGSGKSTLLRVVAGLEPPDGGRVYYDDRDVTDVPPKDRGIGMVFQNYALYPHMESQSNIGFFFKMHKREQEIPERVKIVSEIMGVGFAELLEKKPKELSGGQQQRVAIARCIARDPALFLLDEPLSNLDAKLRARTRVEIKRLLRRFAITTLYVTHDQVEAIALGDRIAVMRRGQVEQIAPYRTVHDEPRNAFVGTFIGVPPMNIMPVTLTPERRLAAPGIDLPLPGTWDVGDRESLLLGVRAEDLRFEAADPHLRLAVDVVEPVVQERMQFVHGAVGEQKLVAKLGGEVEVRRGDVLPLAVDLERLHLFDAATEERLPRP